jgi:restriction system protein
MTTVLKRGIQDEPFLDFSLVETATRLPDFQPGDLAFPAPSPDRLSYRPTPPNGLSSVLPTSWVRYAQDLVKGREAYHQALIEHQAIEKGRLAALQKANTDHHSALMEAQACIAQERADFKRNFEAGRKREVGEYLRQVIQRRLYPTGFPYYVRTRVDETKLLVELELPPFEIAPDVVEYKYYPRADEIRPSPRTMPKRRALYNSIVSQITLLVIRDVFVADRSTKIQTILFKGFVNGIDRATGNPVSPCIISMDIARDDFLPLTLDRVDPEACLKSLHARVSPRPDELAPVPPVFTYSLSDPRFVDLEEADVLSSLENRTNVATIDPTAFEQLIVNLFQKLGYEAVRRTRSWSDGGIDCVAVDPHPIHGISVWIQAKRWTINVSPSAVRELWGTLTAGRASVGILVTTSDFASGCRTFLKEITSQRDLTSPIKLWNGSNLLWLLNEYMPNQFMIQLPGRPPTQPVRPYIQH